MTVSLYTHTWRGTRQLRLSLQLCCSLLTVSGYLLSKRYYWVRVFFASNVNSIVSFQSFKIYVESKTHNKVLGGSVAFYFDLNLLKSSTSKSLEFVRVDIFLESAWNLIHLQSYFAQSQAKTVN